jgi:hypothetical protein
MQARVNHTAPYLVSHNTIPANNTKTSYSRWFSPSNLSLRLFHTATTTCILDTLITTLTTVSNPINDFFSARIPAMITGVLGIAPSLIPFLPNIFCCKNSMPENTEDDALQKTEQHSNELFQSINQSITDDKHQELKIKIAQIKEIQKNLLAEQNKLAENPSDIKCENFINSTYLLIRTVNGILMIIKATKTDTEARDKMDTITNWVNAVLNIAYILYMVAALIPSKRKESQFTSSQVLFTPPNNPAERDEEQSVSITLNAPLLANAAVTPSQ